VTLVIQYFVYHTTVNRTVQLTLIPITIGVGYATVYDLDVNFVGTGEPTFSKPSPFLSSSSLCDVRSGRHGLGSDLHQHLPEVFGLQRSAASLPHCPSHRRGLSSFSSSSHYRSYSLCLSQGMIVMCPFFDDVGALMKYEYTSGCVFRIGLLFLPPSLPPSSPQF
jgi:hypothetical protein